jgi:hypothetical protein
MKMTSSFATSTRVKLYEQYFSGCYLEQEIRPVSLEPFVSRAQWQTFVDEVNQLDRCGRDSVAGRIANGLGLTYIVGLLLSFAFLGLFQVYAAPYVPNHWFYGRI